MELIGMNETYIVYIDPGHILLDVFIVGCVLSYIAVIFNVMVVILFSRKGLESPSSVLMQGLAIADGLTAFCSYGLQPVFQPIIDRNVDFIWALLGDPYSAIYAHLSQFVESFHLLSVILTTMIGLQKVIAIKFPIWTKANMNCKLSGICCFLCFVITLSLDIPRHLTLTFSGNMVILRNPSLLRYTAVVYNFLHIAITVISAFLMMVSTVFIVYKLFTNRFRHPQTNQRRKERRSAIMISVVLVVFLLTEIPKLAVFLVSYPRLYERVTSTIYFEFGLTFSYNLYVGLTFPIGDRVTFPLFLIEGMKLFTLIGCLSNFIIYITMSKNLRTALRVLFYTKINVNDATNQNKGPKRNEHAKNYKLASKEEDAIGDGGVSSNGKDAGEGDKLAYDVYTVSKREGFENATNHGEVSGYDGDATNYEDRFTKGKDATSQRDKLAYEGVKTIHGDKLAYEGVKTIHGDKSTPERAAVGQREGSENLKLH